MFCPECRTQTNPSDRFCGTCGAKCERGNVAGANLSRQVWLICFGCFGAILVFFVVFAYLNPGGNPSSTATHSSASEPSSTPQTAEPKASGSPVIRYRVIPSKQTAQDRPWAYAVVAHAPSYPELVDLAFDLRERFPDTHFVIIDDSSHINALDRFFDDPEENPYPKGWGAVHDFAMVNQFLDRGDLRWELAGDDAAGSMKDKVIADLESASAVSPTSQTPLKRSNAPVMHYRVITSKQKRSSDTWAYVVVGLPPTNQELVNLAFDLHQKFPKVRFQIYDDSSGLNAIDRNPDADMDKPFPYEWRKAHYFGAIQKFKEPGGDKWQLEAGDANRSMNNEIIANLE